MNKISTCGVAVISNPTLCDVCVFHAAVFSEMKSFAVLVFLITFLKPKFDLNSSVDANLRQTHTIEGNNMWKKYRLSLSNQSSIYFGCQTEAVFIYTDLTRLLPPGARCSIDTWRSEDRNKSFILSVDERIMSLKIRVAVTVCRWPFLRWCGVC